MTDRLIEHLERAENFLRQSEAELSAANELLGGEHQEIRHAVYNAKEAREKVSALLAIADHASREAGSKVAGSLVSPFAPHRD